MSDTQSIKDRLDIVEFIQEYVPLKQAGANWKAPCPFHQEKTPSFMANRDKQIWHCFGCSKGGDIFTFLQEIEGLEFVESLKLLANKAGVTLERSTQTDAQRSRKNRLLDILSFAAGWYHQGLVKSPRSQAARDYLGYRGVPQELWKTFQIGFVPEQWDLLTKSLLKQGWGVEDCVASGLTIQRQGGGAYDRFRGRIMYPITNVHGSVVGFTGRVLVEHEKSGGKYVNTPQTAVYDKSRVIYGLHMAKQQIRRQGFAIVVEGQMDVVAGHKAQTNNIVASSGTAFADQQLQLLGRYTKELRIAFDQDAAGVAAATRGVAAALVRGFAVKVISIPEQFGKDPDDCIQKDPAVWQQAIENAQPFMKFLVDHAVSKHKGDIRALSAALQPALILLKSIENAMEQGYWIRYVADQAGIREDDVRQQLGRDKGSSAKRPPVKKPLPAGSPELPRYVKRLQLLVAISIAHQKASVYLQKIPKQLVPEDLVAIFDALVVYSSQVEPSSKQEGYSVIEKQLNKEGAHKLSTLQLLAESLELNERDAIKEAQILSQALRSGWLKRRREKLIIALKQAESSGDKARVSVLLEQLQSLT